MPTFKCVTEGCTLRNVELESSMPPMACPNTDRCDICIADSGEVISAPPDTTTSPRACLQIAGRTYFIYKTSVLGRNGDVEPELFREHLGISREHCRLELDEKHWAVHSLTRISPTSVNGTVLGFDERVRLCEMKNRLILGEVMDIEIILDVPSSSSSEQVSDMDDGPLIRYKRNKTAG